MAILTKLKISNYLTDLSTEKKVHYPFNNQSVPQYISSNY
jgi:hypothetical protein